jgi:integrase
MGLIQHNPVSAVASPSVQRKEEQRALDTDEIKVLLNAATGTRFDIPIRFTLAAGLRQGELLDLSWSDLNLDAGLLNCAGTKSPKSRRAIELSAGTISLLRAHKQEQLERRMRSGPAWQKNGLVFPTTKGTRWPARIFYRDYKKVVSAAELSDPETILWHTLRHTAASQWIAQGADIFTVSRRLGHASAAFTMDVYAHLLRGQQTVAAEAMDTLIRRA